MKPRRVLYGMSVAAVMLIVTSARAEAVHLTCNHVEGSDDTGEQPLTLEESASSAAFGDDPVSRAEFTDTKVTWESKTSYSDAYNRWSCTNSYDLSRDTGKLHRHRYCESNHWKGVRPTAEFDQCEVSRKKF
jgi:hypothetical protein